ncbi:nucleoside monophosphate kinase [Planctomycetota bacterium]|nr:nucleoside monophosphate kinase [Planctomycetota bacterium]
MRKFVIMGVQGSGKGTQSRMLCNTYGFKHISTGDMFREEIQSQSPIAEKIKNLINQGNLVPDEIVSEVVRKGLSQLDDSKGFILDGFPRNAAQAQFLIDNIDIDAVIVLEIPDQVVIERIMSRRLCSECKRDYNIDFRPPTVEGICDDCGGKLIQREDDYEEAVKKRIADYHASTSPAIELLSTKYRVERFDVTKGSKYAQPLIRECLGLSELEEVH